MTQGTLATDIPQDALSRLLWDRDSDVPCRVRDYFVGALHLGDESNKFARGWWRREKLPEPVVVLAVLTADEAVEVYDRTGRWNGSCGWRVHHVAYAPTRRIVEWETFEARSKKGRHRITRSVSPVRQLRDSGYRLFCEGLTRIRAELEVFTGTTRYTTEDAILDGLRGMPDHWARAMIALHAREAPRWARGRKRTA